MKNKYLVTAALPYANGPLHLGHLAGAYIPADIYVRYMRLFSEEVLFICGTDEHGVPITLRAKDEGVTAPEIVEKYNKEICEDFRNMLIDFDIFSGTSTSPAHTKLSQEFFKKIHEKGYIEKRVADSVYCPTDKMFLADRYVEGECPACGQPGSKGDQCEKCGTWNEAKDLKNPICKICGSTPEIRKSAHWYFLLDKLIPALTKFLDDRPHLRSNVAGDCRRWLKDIRARSITRDLDWGVPVPLADAKGKVLYVWFDAPIGYVSFTEELGGERGKDLVDEWWKNKDTRIIHFIGKDNIVFHGLIWPGMLSLMDGYNLPWDIPANEFLNFKGEKFSTSSGRAIWVKDFLKDYSVERGRYYLLAISPENKDANYDPKDFIEKTNQDLANNFGNFINRVLTFSKKYANSKIDEKSHDPAWLFEGSREIRTRIIEQVQGLHLREITIIFQKACHRGNQAFDKAEPWNMRKTRPEAVGPFLRTMIEWIGRLAIISLPIFPKTGPEILKLFGLDENSAKTWFAENVDKLLPVSEAHKDPKIFFPRIEEAA